MTHASSGMQYGHATIPRIGSEVLVQYLDGDIDQPIVTGMAYNPTKKHAYDLPAHKTRSYWKDQTHKGDGFNEIRFESEKGQEEIFLHAQKNTNSVVKNDSYQNIGRFKHTEVGRDYSLSAYGDATHRIAGTFGVNSNGGVALSAGFPIGNKILSSEEANLGLKDSTIFEFAKKSFFDTKNLVPTGGITLTAATNIMEQAGLSKSSIVANASREMIGKAKVIHAGEVVQLNSGGTTLVATADNTAIESGERIDIVCGDSSIRLMANGTIEIEGINVKIRGNKISLN